MIFKIVINFRFYLYVDLKFLKVISLDDALMSLRNIVIWYELFSVQHSSNGCLTIVISGFEGFSNRQIVNPC